MKIEEIKNAIRVDDKLYAEIQAACLYLERRDRNAHPSGHFDKAGRWYARGRDADILCPCRPPSRRWPYSEMLACRSLRHCARYYDADELITRRIAVAIEHLVADARVTKTSEKYVRIIQAIVTTNSL